MAGIGEAMEEFAALVEESCDDAIGERHGADRQVARGQALGHRHDVGLEPHGLEAQPVAGAAEAADDFVGNEQDAVFAADALRLPANRSRAG